MDMPLRENKFAAYWSVGPVWVITTPSGPYKLSLSPIMITGPSGPYRPLSRTVSTAPSGPHSFLYPLLRFMQA